MRDGLAALAWRFVRVTVCHCDERRELLLNDNTFSGAVPEAVMARVHGNQLTYLAGNVLCGPSPFHQATSCFAMEQKDALQRFFSETGGAAWTHSDNWMVGNPCTDSWYGVACDDTNTKITCAPLPVA